MSAPSRRGSGDNAAVAGALRWASQASAGEGGQSRQCSPSGLSFRVHANRRNSSSGNADAIAGAVIDPPAIVHILGNASVNASALNRGAGSDDETAASANAQLHFTNFATVTVDGNAAVGAHATNFGLGQVNANGIIDFGGAGNINLGGVQIDISARNEGSAAGGPGVNAAALFNEANGAVNLSISSDIKCSALAAGKQQEAAPRRGHDQPVHPGRPALSMAESRWLQCVQRLRRRRVVPVAFSPFSAGRPSSMQRADGRWRYRWSRALAVPTRAQATPSPRLNAFILALAGANGGITVGSVTDKARAVDSGAGTASAQAFALLDGGNHGPIDHIPSPRRFTSMPRPDNHSGSASATISAPSPCCAVFAHRTTHLSSRLAAWSPSERGARMTGRAW